MRISYVNILISSTIICILITYLVWLLEEAKEFIKSVELILCDFETFDSSKIKLILSL